MTTKDEASRLAECFDTGDYSMADIKSAAAELRRLSRAALAEKQEPVKYTTGHCKDKRENNGVCPNHNLQCGYPLCDRKAAHLAPVQSQDAQDAKRYRWLKDNCSYNYPMQPDSPAEHGIEYQWQQGCYDERNQGINGSIDAAIAAAEGSKE